MYVKCLLIKKNWQHLVTFKYFVMYNNIVNKTYQVSQCRRQYLLLEYTTSCKRYNDKQTTARMVCDSLIALSKVCFAIISAAFSYFSLYKSCISKYSDAMNNNHISQFSQFLLARARQQASWDGKHTTVIAAPHYPVYRGKRVLTLWRTRGRSGWDLQAHSEVVGRVDKQQTQSSRAGCRPVDKQLAND